MADLPAITRANQLQTARARMDKTEAAATAIGEIVEICCQLCEFQCAGIDVIGGVSVHAVIARAETLIASGEFDRARKAASRLFEPATIAEIQRELSVLFAAVATTAKNRSDDFYKIAAYDVSVSCPSLIVLATACRHLRRTQTFTPTIARILDAIEAEKRRYGDGAELQNMPQMVLDLRQCLEARKDGLIRECIHAITAKTGNPWTVSRLRRSHPELFEIANDRVRQRQTAAGMACSGEVQHG